MTWERSLFRLLLGAREPITAGKLAVQGVLDSVQIGRDGWGVAYIDASNDADAWFGLGFCHGQDRTFQVELLRRVVHGTVAELVGPEGLPIDRMTRRLGLVHHAREQLAVVAPDIRETVEAYAAGVTAGATVGRRSASPEFVLLRSPFTPWTGADVLGLGKLQSFLLATNWDVELARLEILRQDGPEALADLDPTYPEWQPVTAPPGALAGPAIDRLREDLGLFVAQVGIGGGSNSWAIAGDRTASGRPLLANDPHLSPALPSHWYLARIRTPEWSLAGAPFVGAPPVVVGHNGFAAWGVTVGMVDNTDLFLEEMGADGCSVREGSGFIPCGRRVERIAVRGAEPLIEEVLTTRRGPIIGPALSGELGAVSIRATWLDPEPAEGLFRLARARSFEQFRRAFARWPTLSFNMLYADEQGTIGWQLAGQAPRRKRGHGELPLWGWDPDSGWEDRGVPFDEMPHCTNPDAGFIATANAKPLPGDEGPFLTVDWIDGYRLARIAEVLGREGKASRDDARALQLDQLSIPWREIRDAVLDAPCEDGGALRVQGLLRAWDGCVSAESSAAAAFEVFAAEMSARVARVRAPNSWRFVLGAGLGLPGIGTAFGARRVSHLSRLMRERPSGWFDRGWDVEIADALRTVASRLERERGPDPAGWAWGNLRPLTLVHLLGTRKPLDRIFNLGPFPWGGDSNTVGQASVNPLEPSANPNFIPSLRMIVEAGQWEDAVFALPGGQSGNPSSSHYADQLPLWKTGDGIHIAWSDEAIRRSTSIVLTLVPG